jgi:hypothetical protein
VTVLPWHALQEAVQAGKAGASHSLNTCHSGHAYSPRLGNAAHHAV